MRANTSQDRLVPGRLVPGLWALGRPAVPTQRPQSSHICPNKRPRRRVPGAASTCLGRDRNMSVVDAGFDGEHRAGGVKQDSLGIGPQDQLAYRSASAQADHDEVCVDLVGDLDQVL